MESVNYVNMGGHGAVPARFSPDSPEVGMCTDHAGRHGRDDSGFTLVELLLVILILGVLSAVTYFAVSGLSDSGQEEACRVDKKNVETAIAAYQAKFDPNFPGVAGVTDSDSAIGELVAKNILNDAPSDDIYDISVDITNGSVTDTSGTC